MAGTPDGRALTEAHRTAQLGIKARLSADIAALWPMLDLARLDDTAPAWLAAMLQLIGLYRRESAESAAAYYLAHRDAETAGDTDNNRTPAPAIDPGRYAQPDRERAATSLMVTGPVAVKVATGKGVDAQRASKVAQQRATAAATRHVLDAGRAVLRDAVRDDPRALGWARVTDADPCAFCAMLASRGPTYKSKRTAMLGDDGEVYHDGCACVPEPVYSLSAPWPGRAREFAALWADSTRGLSGAEARAAFRRAVEGRTKPAASEPDRLRNQDRNQPAPAEPMPQPAEVVALDPAALAQLSDEDLLDAFAVESNRDTVRDDVLDALLAEMDRRDAPAADPDPLAGLDLDRLADFELFDLWAEHDTTPSAVERIGAELDRRDSERGNALDLPDPDTAGEDSPEAAETLAQLDADLDAREQQAAREARIDALVARGWSYAEAYAEAHDLDADAMRRQELAAAVERQAGETLDRAVRRLYDEWVALQWIQAEQDTRGYLLSAAGVAAGIDPRSLWGGRADRARKYASEELKRWWEDHPRMTLTEFRASMLGRDRDLAAARAGAGRGNGRDFGL